VGSGNLTFTGFGDNHEVFTCLDWTPDQPRNQPLFAQAWDLVKTLMHTWAHSSEAMSLLRKAEYVADWLRPAMETDAGIQLFHNLQEPLLDQFSRALGDEDIEKLTVLSPFLDVGAEVLRALHARFRPQELRLILQSRRTVGNPEALQRLLTDGLPLRFFRFDDDDRYLHAKIYLFETARTSYALTGSANCTRSAWLLAAGSGNVEVMLLRRGASREHFAPLLAEYVSPHAVSSLDEIEIKHWEPLEAQGEPSPVRLLEVAASGGLLSVNVDLVSIAEDLAGYFLRVSTSPPYYLRLKIPGVGAHSLQLSIPEEMKASLKQSLSASVWGIDSEHQPVDLSCNELWITNVDALRHATLAISSDYPRAADSLRDLIVSSEDEWGELYDCLVPLVQLDISQMKRQGGGYVRGESSGRRDSDTDVSEQETEVRLVRDEDEVSVTEEDRERVLNEVAREGQFSAFFDHVRGRLPASISDTGGGARSAPEPHKRQKRRKWTPSRRMGRRFLNLVKKYIGSLANVDYMLTLPIPYILGYYAVFQRIVWLLLQHRVIDEEAFVHLVLEINSGFFGTPDDGPPATSPRLHRHIQRVWRTEWQTAEVPAHALASVILTRRQVSRIQDGPLGHQVREQNLRVVCGVAGVMGLAWQGEIRDVEQFTHVAGAYGQNGKAFTRTIAKLIRGKCRAAEAILESWIRKVEIAIGENEDPRQKQLLYRARVDYGWARYDALASLRDVEAQAALCSDLIFWMLCAGESQAIETLIDFLQEQGRSHQVAKAMLREGKDLNYAQQHGEAADKLRQAFLLAERLGDSKLSAQCKTFLRSAELFMK
jgi:hypothetical protein